jgi:hypothetical protein
MFFIQRKNWVHDTLINLQILEAKFNSQVQTYLFDFFDGDYTLLREYLSSIDIGFVGLLLRI